MTRASHVAPAANAAPVSFGEDGRSVRNATAAEQLTARLDRLPMTRALWIMVILLTFGGLFDGYAIGLIGALGPGLFKANIFTPTPLSFFGFTGFASFVAALFAGFFIASLLCSCHISQTISVGAQSSPTPCCGLALPTLSWGWRTQRTASISGASSARWGLASSSSRLMPTSPSWCPKRPAARLSPFCKP
jgi:hypothetical protein